jgi:hypothetical protein
MTEEDGWNMCSPKPGRREPEDFEKVVRKNGSVAYFCGASHIEIYKGHKQYCYLGDQFNFASEIQLAMEKHFGLEDLPQIPNSPEDAIEAGWTEYCGELNPPGWIL